mgnify:CR=1 FL=1
MGPRSICHRPGITGLRQGYFFGSLPSKRLQSCQLNDLIDNFVDVLKAYLQKSTLGGDQLFNLNPSGNRVLVYKPRSERS